MPQGNSLNYFRFFNFSIVIYWRFIDLNYDNHYQNRKGDFHYRSKNLSFLNNIFYF